MKAYTSGSDPVNGDGNVYGYAFTGNTDDATGDKAALTAYNGFKVWGADTDTTNATYQSTGLDPARVSGGYPATYALPTTPTPLGWSTTYGAISGSKTIQGSSDPANPYYVSASSISLSGSEQLTIKGYVVLVLTGDIKMAGQSTIALQQTPGVVTSSLRIYTPGNIAIAGNGVANWDGISAGTTATTSTQTGNLSIYGTNPTPGGQEISFSGNAGFSGAVNAPNANVTFNGGGNKNDPVGQFYGSLQGYSAKVNGKVSFHFDESLNAGGGDNTIGSYPVNYWIEPVNKADMSKFGFNTTTHTLK